MKILYPAFFCFTFFLLVEKPKAQEIEQVTNPTVGRIEATWENYTKNKHFSQIYFNTDKKHYSVSEEIWFKARVMQPNSFSPDSLDDKLIIEIVSEFNEIVQLHIARLINGEAEGKFQLTDTLHDGPYLLRAYTTVLAYKNPKLRFEEPIYITNSKPKNIAYGNRTLLKKYIKQSKKFTLEVFPEGGTLIYGRKSGIVCKLSDQNENPVIQELSLYENKIKIASTTTNTQGLAWFSIIPFQNKKYTIEYKNKPKKHASYSINNIKTTGTLLSTQQESDKITINLFSNLSKTNAKFTNEVVVLLHTETQMLNSFVLDVTDSVQWQISTNELPKGIIYISVVNQLFQVLNRTAFFNLPQAAPVEISLSKLQYKLNDTVEVKIKATPNASLVVNVNTQQSRQKKLFSSFSTFNNKNIYTDETLHWQAISQSLQFNLSAILTPPKAKKTLLKPIEKPEFKLEKGLSVSGKLARVWFELPVKNNPVQLTILNSYNDIYTDTTDSNGRFEFNKLFYTDTMEILLEAKTARGKYRDVFILDEFEFPPVGWNRFAGLDTSLILFKKRRNYGEAPEIPNDDEIGKLHSGADQVIRNNDKNPIPYSSVWDMIRGRVPGYSGGRLRGSSYEPLYLLDGTPIDASTVGALSPNDIDRIEILKSPQHTAIYGLKGMGGVIAIYTKRGYNIIRGKLQLKLPAFGKKLTLKTKYTDSENLYRNSKITTNQAGECSFKFILKQPGSYLIWVEGFDSENNYLEKSVLIDVN